MHRIGVDRLDEEDCSEVTAERSSLDRLIHNAYQLKPGRAQ
jgi:hypothetical protein